MLGDLVLRGLRGSWFEGGHVRTSQSNTSMIIEKSVANLYGQVVSSGLVADARSFRASGPQAGPGSSRPASQRAAEEGKG